MRPKALTAAAAEPLTTSSPVMAYPAQVVGDLHLRAGPSKGFPIVRVLYTDMPVEVLGCESNSRWCDVEVNGHRGWANADFLKATLGRRPMILAQQDSALAVPGITFCHWRLLGQPLPPRSLERASTPLSQPALRASGAN